MLVRFVSSETAEVLMFAEVAKMLLQVVGKESTARGVFTQPEMLDAARLLREAVKRAEAEPSVEEEEDEARGRKQPVVAFGQRAWPLIDMLERTARGKDASITWEAPAAF